MKRFISVLVVLCCLVGLCPMQVMAAVDLDPPVVAGAYLSAPGAEFRAGDIIDLSILVSDQSDVVEVTGRAYPINEDGSIDRRNDIFIYCPVGIYGEYSKSTGIFLARIPIKDNIVDGKYYITELNVKDKYGNEIRLSCDVPGNINFTNLWFIVAGNSQDKDPPEVLSAQLTQVGVTAKAGDVVDLCISVSDASEIVEVTGRAYPVDKDGLLDTRNDIFIYCPVGELGEYDESAGIFTAHIQIDDNIADGTYFITSLNICDKYGNEAWINDDISDSVDFASLWFSVSGNSQDRDPPEVLSAQLAEEGITVSIGEIVNLYITVSDISDIVEVTGRAYRANEDGTIDYGHDFFIYCPVGSRGEYDSSAGVFTAKIEIDDKTIEGTYFITQLHVSDRYDNETWLYSSEQNNVYFSKLWFTVASQNVLPEKVSLPEHVHLPVRSIYTVAPDVTPVEAIPTWTWESEDPSIATANVAGNGTIVQITGLKVGTTTITGTTSNGLSAHTVVTVTDVPLPTGGSVEASYNVGLSGFVDIHPNLLPPGATSLYEVTSDNLHVASVEITSENNTVRIRGNNAGKATVTIRGANGISMTTTIIVGRPTDRQHEQVVIEGRESTCQWQGWTEGLGCSACRYIFVEPEELPLAPHKEETVPGREATCTRTGLTDAVRCSYCYTYLVEPEEIPMKPHTYSEWEIIVEATPYSTGLRCHYCEVCGHYEEEEYSFTPEPTPRPSQPSTAGPDPTTEPTPSPNPTTEPTPAPTATVEPTPEPTKPQVNVGDQNIEVTVDENTAAVTVPEQDLEEAIDAAAEKGVLEVDVSNLEDVSQFTLSQNVVNAVTKSEDVTGLKLKTANGDITLDGNALQTVADTITSENDEVKLTVKTIDPKDIPDSKKYPIAPVLNRAVFIELSADVIHKDASGTVTGTDAIHEFNGDVTVSVPYEQPENMKGRQVIACYIADDGSITYFNVVYKDGIATFTTRHFSTFAIVESYAAVFEDIDISKWYMTSIEYALAHEFMAGESETIFAPDGMVSRAMAVQLLYNLSGKPETDVSATFTDVDAGKWYAPAIAWAEKKKVAAGYGNNQFGPDDSVTREQLATMLWQYAGRPETTGSIDSYEDAADVSSWAKKALCWAVENGIMQGSANHLNPKATASRAEAAALMANLHQVLQSGKSA